MKSQQEKTRGFTDMEREIIASSLEAVLDVNLWLYCWYQDNERARLGNELTPEKDVRDVVRRARANELEGFGHFELTMMREALLATLAAGLELGATRDHMLATVRQIQSRRTELAIRQEELEGSDTARMEHFRFNAELATRAFGDLAGLTPREVNSYLGARLDATAERRASDRRHLAVAHDVEQRSEEWLRRDRDTWDPVPRWHLYWQVDTFVCETTSLLQGPNYNELPSQQRDRVLATILRIAPLVDWYLPSSLADDLGIVTPPQCVFTD